MYQASQAIAAASANQNSMRAIQILLTAMVHGSMLPAAPALAPMHIPSDVIDLIGRTPLLRLRRASELTGCEILGKAEFMNPGGSVKDRAALFIVRDAEQRGLLRPGGVIVEGPAGHTGRGPAL